MIPDGEWFKEQMSREAQPGDGPRGLTAKGVDEVDEAVRVYRESRKELLVNVKKTLPDGLRRVEERIEAIALLPLRDTPGRAAVALARMDPQQVMADPLLRELARLLYLEQRAAAGERETLG